MTWDAATGRGGADSGAEIDTPPGPGLARRLRLMTITEPEPRSGLRLEDVVQASLRGGATAVQIRDKSARGGELLAQVTRLLPIAKRYEALVIVNDRFDVAIAAGAHGVHLGPDDLPVDAVRARVPAQFVIGFSCDDPASAREAARRGADYLGVGAVYGTRSKAGLEEEAIGPERVGEVLRAAGLPGVGIGGIVPASAAAVARQGAGVAVLSAVMHAEDPEARTRELLRALAAGGAKDRGG